MLQTHRAVSASSFWVSLIGISSLIRQAGAAPTCMRLSRKWKHGTQRRLLSQPEIPSPNSEIRNSYRLPLGGQACTPFYEAGYVKAYLVFASRSFAPIRSAFYSSSRGDIFSPAGPLNSAMTPILPERVQLHPRAWHGLSSCVSFANLRSKHHTRLFLHHAQAA